ncbi:MAG: aminotransferase [Bacteroidetes bacterium]|nr:MAG: aminotransferase [Bacteroidota bacterium]
MNKEDLVHKLDTLKKRSGTHSPSISTIRREIPDLEINIDACFLSNPYATQLFYKNIERDLLETNKLRDIIEFYPGQNYDIAKLISQAIDCPAESIFVGNGAAEVIQAVLQRFGGERILINIPTFSAYYEFLLESQEVCYFRLKKEDDFKLNVEEYIKEIQRLKPSTIVLINPNNPDGGYLTKDALESILNATKDIVETVIVDESFIHFAYESDDLNPIQSTHYLSTFSNLVIVKSMSKDFGIAGIRAGYAVMNNERVSELTSNGFLWNISGLAEYFFTLYTSEKFKNEYEVVRKKYIMNTMTFLQEIGQIDKLSVYPSKANFALVEIKNGMTSWEFTRELLLRYGIYVRDCSDKIGLEGEFVRIASRTFEENFKIVEALKTLLAE